MFGIFSQKKNHTAQVNNSKVEVAAGDNLLNAALSSGIAWPHNCRVGSCGTCRCKLVDGKIKPLNDFSYVLDEDELDAGYILACQTRLRSDVTIEVELDSTAKTLIEPETIEGEIKSLTNLTHDIVEVRVALNKKFPGYLAGQYADLKIDGVSDARSYSFSRAPTNEDANVVSFFVRKVPNGEMSTRLHNSESVGNPVSISGPHGTFYLRDSDAPAICVAGGSGLAPIKALLEQFQKDGFDRQVVFLFGARTQKDLYCIEEMQELCKQQSKFSFVPVLSEEEADSDWDGARGMVTEFIDKQGIDVAGSQAYLCGPPPMIDSAIEVFKSNGVTDTDIFFDKFLDASHLPDGKR